jgi:hypothetical protein
LVGSFSAGSLGHDNTSNLLQDQQEQSRMSNENIRARRIFAAFEGIDFENLSPKKALDLLWELKEI